MRVADYVIGRLAAEGIKHIFMVTGRGILYLSDAVARCEDVEGISVHHEQAASYASMAYAECGEDIGACLVSTGCAAANAITGLLCAWQDGVPCVFISGQNMLRETTRYTGRAIRTFGQQEADIIEVVKPWTKYAVMLTEPERAGYELDKALYMAREGRKGPVWMDIPLDIQNMRINEETLAHFVADAESDSTAVAAEEELEQTVRELRQSERPVFLIGSGIRAAGAAEEFGAFINRYPYPVVFDTAAVDVYGLDNPCSIGAVGTPSGTRAGNFAVQNADFVIVLGCRLSPMTTGPQYEKFARGAKIIVVDIDEEEHRKETVRIDRFIRSDARAFLRGLADRDPGGASGEWLEKCARWKTIFPKCEEKYKNTEQVDLYFLADCLSRQRARESVFLCDAGIEELIFPVVMSFGRGQRCIHPVSQGAMGFALPAAIGAYYASKRQVVAVCGDGSVMMNLQELQTICYHKIPVKLLITNNDGYAVIRRRQRELFRSRTIGTDETNGVSCPDFSKLAAAFGIDYMKIERAKELEAKIGVFLSVEGPGICEVMCVREQEYICNGYARTSGRRFVQRPLEDQAPFMDRETFLSEMIVEPIDL